MTDFKLQPLVFLSVSCLSRRSFKLDRTYNHIYLCMTHPGSVLKMLMTLFSIFGCSSGYCFQSKGILRYEVKIESLVLLGIVVLVNKDLMWKI